ncbi:transposase [Myroides ceti]|uniref:Transposase n=1 Tax=Paenimyroides ceti TaxID=395087 RepID=A0ABT8CY57_9FLAO|nr:transposase [Paenimyroides ceti]MDN3707904.1 transposase [Paenimyroides ceti]MDN3709130.1 transposase [Paenimyroides ceti]
MFLKDIHIGKLLKQRVEELEMDPARITAFMRCTEQEILTTYKEKMISTDRLLRWSKLLGYDFFRLYSGHLVLYHRDTSIKINNKDKSSSLPVFRKNIYTKEIIDYIVDQISTKKKTIKEVITDYQIPTNTLYRWLKKHTKQ